MDRDPSGPQTQFLQTLAFPLVGFWGPIQAAAS